MKLLDGINITNYGNNKLNKFRLNIFINYFFFLYESILGGLIDLFLC